MKIFSIFISLFLFYTNIYADHLDLLLLSGHSIQKRNLMPILATHPNLLKGCRYFLKALPDNSSIQANFLKLWHQIEKEINLTANEFCIIHHLNFSSQWSKDIMQLLLNPQVEEPSFLTFEENLQQQNINNWLQKLHMYCYAPCGHLFSFLQRNVFLGISEEQRCVWELLDCIYLAQKNNLNLNSVLHLFEIRFKKSQGNNIFSYAIFLKALHKGRVDFATI